MKSTEESRTAEKESLQGTIEKARADNRLLLNTLSSELNNLQLQKRSTEEQYTRRIG